ncbi:MAG: hypothetical protein ABFE07_29050 [Armatimonadia bacterium]
MGSYHQAGRRGTEERIARIVRMDPGCRVGRVRDQLDYSLARVQEILKAMTERGEILRRRSGGRYHYYPVRGAERGQA